MINHSLLALAGLLGGLLWGNLLGGLLGNSLGGGLLGDLLGSLGGSSLLHGFGGSLSSSFGLLRASRTVGRGR